MMVTHLCECVRGMAKPGSSCNDTTAPRPLDIDRVGNLCAMD